MTERRKVPVDAPCVNCKSPVAVRSFCLHCMQGPLCKACHQAYHGAECAKAGEKKL